MEAPGPLDWALGALSVEAIFILQGEEFKKEDRQVSTREG